MKRIELKVWLLNVLLNLRISDNRLKPPRLNLITKLLKNKNSKMNREKSNLTSQINNPKLNPRELIELSTSPKLPRLLKFSTPTRPTSMKLLLPVKKLLDYLRKSLELDHLQLSPSSRMESCLSNSPKNSKKLRPYSRRVLRNPTMPSSNQSLIS